MRDWPRALAPRSGRRNAPNAILRVCPPERPDVRWCRFAIAISVFASNTRGTFKPASDERLQLAHGRCPLPRLRYPKAVVVAVILEISVCPLSGGDFDD